MHVVLYAVDRQNNGTQRRAFGDNGFNYYFPIFSIDQRQSILRGPRNMIVEPEFWHLIPLLNQLFISDYTTMRNSLPLPMKANLAAQTSIHSPCRHE
jgi:hypothetical protein